MTARDTQQPDVEAIREALRDAREFVERARPLLGIAYGDSLGARADALYVALGAALASLPGEPRDESGYPGLQGIEAMTHKPARDEPCPACFGKGLEGQDDRPGLLLDTVRGTDECRVCGGTGRASGAPTE